MLRFLGLLLVIWLVITVAALMTSLGHLYRARGRLADAEPLLTEALDMTKRLFKGDHPSVATTLSNLARQYH